MTLAPAIRHAAKYGGVLIGHTRQATTGAVNHDNAHPFLDKESAIAWAHNGMIHNYQTFGEYEVDSECLIHGIKALDFSKYNGPIALVWIKDSRLHAFRKGNPLYRGLRNKAVYLASEEDMLKEIGCTRVKELAEGQVYAWRDTELISHQRVPFNKDTYSVGNWRSGQFTGCGEDYTDEWWNKDRRDRNIALIPERKTLAAHTCHTLCLKRRDWNAAIPAIHTLAEPTAEEHAELEHEIIDAETLCMQCYEKKKLSGSDYCGDCYLRTGGLAALGD